VPQRPADRLRGVGVSPAPRQRGTRALLVPVGVGAAALIVVAGVPLWLLGVPVVLVVLRIRRERAANPPDVPLFADLLAACLLAGATVPDALTVAADACGPRLAGAAAPVVARLRAGDEPDEAFADWRSTPDLDAVGRICVRSLRTGASAAPQLVRAAARLRSTRTAELQQRVARMSVWVVLPLGTCFLPAFVLLGVVPLAWGLLHSVL
jgi:pilus assembly protein TadC